MLRPVIRGSNRLIGGSWFFRLRLHRLALPSPHQRSCGDAVVLGWPGSEPFALNQRSRRSERREVFFRGRWGWGAGDERRLCSECGRSCPSVRTALCCNAGVDDQAQTPPFARFSDEQRKIREVTVSKFWSSLCSVDVFS